MRNIRGTCTVCSIISRYWRHYQPVSLPARLHLVFLRVTSYIELYRHTARDTIKWLRTGTESVIQILLSTVYSITNVYLFLWISANLILLPVRYLHVIHTRLLVHVLTSGTYICTHVSSTCTSIAFSLRSIILLPLSNLVCIYFFYFFCINATTTKTEKM